MTTLHEAAQQALEALEESEQHYGSDSALRDAMQILRAALKQPERAQRMRDAGYIRRPTLREMAEEEQPEQEPYCYVYEYDSAFGLHREFYPGPYNGKQKPDRTVPVYTHPPRREWRGLTEDELAELARQEQLLLICDDFDALKEIARAVEAALKEKNA